MGLEDIKAASKEAERVVKKQKTCAARTADGLDSMIAAVQAAREQLGTSPGIEAATCLRALHARLASMDVSATAARETKELHSAVGKLGKAIDKAFLPDICKATRELTFDKDALNQVIAEHLYQSGKFEVGDVFVAEAGVQGGAALKEPFVEMHGVLKEIRAHNLGPALAWINTHRQQLSDSGVPDSFEFKLHRLQYVHTLTTQGEDAALAYARCHFARFKHSQMAEIQRLMGALAFLRRLESSPYSDLLSQDQWADFAHEFAKQCCGLVGQSCESPLLVSVAAGSAALPPLLKLASVLAGQRAEGAGLTTCEQLPVELELGREFVFHSVFACPVSRDAATPDNPPMMLPCGHVLCRGSITKIARSPARSFKCPYCPAEATISACQQLHFPDPEA